jgi:hypothetical protein
MLCIYIYIYCHTYTQITTQAVRCPSRSSEERLMKTAHVCLSVCRGFPRRQATHTTGVIL